MQKALSFEDGSMDGYTVAFGIRNVAHIEKALSEAYRLANSFRNSKQKTISAHVHQYAVAISFYFFHILDVCKLLSIVG
jgi:ubiquinone/menaquinone biosynthesis C-methylase UbiE